MKLGKTYFSGSITFDEGNNVIGPSSATFESITVSNTLNVTGNITGAATTASYVEFTDIANKPTLISSSNQLAGETVDGDLTVTGKLTAQEFHTEYVSGSIIYTSGSTKFGDSADDTHEFTGSLLLNGTLQLGQATSIVNSGLTHFTNGYVYLRGGAQGAAMITDATGTTTGFYANDGGTAVITTADVDRMTVASDGNVTFTKPDDLRITLTDSGDSSSLVLRADLTNEIYTNTNHDLQIYTNGNQNGQIYLDQSNGFVGIGDTSPSYKLDVAGTGGFADDLYTSKNLFVGTTSTLRHPALDRYVTIGSSTNGAVIGYNLTVIDGANNRRGSFFMDDANGLWGLDHTYSSGGMDFVIRIAGGELMRVRSDGQVGIGAVSPRGTLDVIGLGTDTSSDNVSVPSGTLVLGYDGGWNTDNHGASIVFTQRWYSPSSGQIAMGQITGVKERGDGNFGGGLAFWTANQNGSDLVERLRIDEYGQIGINTSGPSYTLDVHGSIGLEGAKALEKVAASGGQVYNKVFTGAIGAVDDRTPAPDHFTNFSLSFGFTSWNLNNSGGWADMLVLQSYIDHTGGDNNVMIVNKNGSGVKIARQAYNSSTSFASGTVYTLDYTSASDQSVKENVQNITGCLDAITSLRPVTYEWTDEYILNGMSKNSNENIVNEETGEIVLPQTKTINVGLIAQEVEQVIPTVVHQENIRLKDREEALKNVSYDKLVPHLIGAIKELKAEIDSLKAQLNG